MQTTLSDLPEKSAEKNDNHLFPQQQPHSTESGLIEEDAKFRSLEDSFNKRIIHLHQQLTETNILIKKEITKQRAKYEEVLNYLSQALSDHDEGDKKIQMAIKNLQMNMEQIQNELKQQKSGYHHAVETYKIQMEAEKKKATEVQETLAQVSVTGQFIDTPLNNPHTKTSVSDQITEMSAKKESTVLAEDQPSEAPVKDQLTETVVKDKSLLKVNKRLSKHLLEKFESTAQEHLGQSRTTVRTKQILVS